VLLERLNAEELFPASRYSHAASYIGRLAEVAPAQQGRLDVEIDRLHRQARDERLARHPSGTRPLGQTAYPEVTKHAPRCGGRRHLRRYVDRRARLMAEPCHDALDSLGPAVWVAAISHTLSVAAVAVSLLCLRRGFLPSVLCERPSGIVRLAECAAAAAADEPLVRPGIDQFALPGSFSFCHA
jgi:hypothetical protein